MENLELEAEIKVHGCMLIGLLLEHLDDSGELISKLKYFKEIYCTDKIE